MKKFRCLRCKKDIPKLLISGELLDDRNFEGVDFYAWFEGNELKVGIDPSKEDYFKGFNEKFWFDYLRDLIKTDLNNMECPFCGADAFEDLHVAIVDENNKVLQGRQTMNASLPLPVQKGFPAKDLIKMMK